MNRLEPWCAVALTATDHKAPVLKQVEFRALPLEQALRLPRTPFAISRPSSTPTDVPTPAMPFHKVTLNPRHRFATVHNYGCSHRCPICSYKLHSGPTGRPGLSGAIASTFGLSLPRISIT